MSTWPTLSPEVRELFRRGAEEMLRPDSTWIEDLHTASLTGELMRPVADDPVLAAGIRRATLANLLHWAAANVQHPGARVSPNTGPEVLETARDMARRGLDASGLDAFRRGQDVAWRRWMVLCFDLTSDPDYLRGLLDVSAVSIATFVEDTLAAVLEQMVAEQTELTRGVSAERRATVSLLLEGAPIARARAESRLGYGLAGPHTAAIVWSATSGVAATQLETAAEAVMRSSRTARRLTVVASAASLWIWLPSATAPSTEELTAAVTAAPDVRVAVGRPGRDVEGFRRSHLEAATTQRMLAGATASQQLAHYDDVQLAALLTGQVTDVDEFLSDTLGGLRHADFDTRATVLTYVRQLGNTTRTAQLLWTHRNTVVRRLARADRLLPRPLAENALAVAGALEVLRWRPV